MQYVKRGIASILLVVLLMTSVSAGSAASYTGTVNADKVFFRQGASTSSIYYYQLSKGTQVTVTDVKGDFYKVTYNKTVGYIMKKYVTLSSSAQKALSSASSSSSSGKYASITSASTISALGSAPGATQKGSSGDNVAKLQQALKIKGYYKSVVDGVYGDQTAAAVKSYQKAAGLSQTGKADSATISKLFGKSTAVSAADDPKMKGITKISQIAVPSTSKKGDTGKNVTALQQALKLKGYYTSSVDGSFGAQTEAAVKNYQKAVGLSQTGKADSSTINKLFGTNITSVEDDPQMKGITKISQITVPATTQKGSSGKNVTALQQALKIKGYYKAPIDGKYGDQTVAAVKAFQKDKGLTQDGKAGNSTIKALFGKNAANYTFTTERLDWFNGGSNVFSGTCVYTIKDVNTGKMFQARRRFGSNHLDTEPLTASDTAIMKSIYGGEWSWNRRAILVLYNGHVYAASMNGMPHGTSSISNNNFDGHFCIHFYNSRTHGSNKVDAGHQNCVSRAMNATW